MRPRQFVVTLVALTAALVAAPLSIEAGSLTPVPYPAPLPIPIEPYIAPVPVPIEP